MERRPDMLEDFRPGNLDKQLLEELRAELADGVNGDGSNGVKIGVETALKDGIRGRN
jgi:hypothetical protein